MFFFKYLKSIFFLFCLVGYAQQVHRVTVYFDKDKFDLKPSETLKIDSTIRLIKKTQDYFVKIDAHTDSDGSEQYNTILSQNRGKTTFDYLSKYKFNPNLMEVSSFGEHHPVVENNSEENMQKNRRARIILVNTLKKIRVRGKVLSSDQVVLPKAKILLQTNQRIDTIFTNELGEYDIWIPKSNPTYTFVSDVKNHFYHYAKINIDTLKGKRLNLNIELKKLKKGELINLPMFHFVENKAILIKESEPNLPYLYEIMKQNPKLKIEIHGHINLQNVGDVPTNSSSYKLSFLRAQLVYDYLRSRKISVHRVKVKAFGNWKMLYPNTTDVKLQDLNRRVEILVVENEE
jgi:outer membrane protein OmpA-like peptidoglycan-associated protein